MAVCNTTVILAHHIRALSAEEGGGHVFFVFADDKLVAQVMWQNEEMTVKGGSLDTDQESAAIHAIDNLLALMQG